jgi:penicillin-binding protein 2
MRRVMEAGTGRGVQLPDIPSGGKTGTAQAPGFNRKDNSVFVMFAPFDQPKVVIAVMVENGGFGAQQAAPIGSLMVEQYLTGHLTRRDLFNHIRTLSSQSL